MNSRVAAQDPGQAPWVAVVDGDRAFREDVLVPALSRAGFQVQGMGGALELYRAKTVRYYDLVLLNADLPDEDGFSIATHLRRLPRRVGIAMLVGNPQISRLPADIDVCLVKPVGVEAILGAMRNLAWQAASATQDATARWQLDEWAWCIVTPGGARIAMNLAERRLMARLAATPGIPVLREELNAMLSGNADDADPHRLEMLVYRLRRKCVKQAHTELPLRAVRGVGYVLTW